MRSAKETSSGTVSVQLLRKRKYSAAAKGGALVALAERMVAGDAEQQGHGERGQIILPISPMVLRARDGALQQPGIANEEGLARLGDRPLVEPDD